MAHSVKFMVEIENFTNQPLHLVNYEIRSGGFQSSPRNIIMPGHKESFSARKISFTPTGASGAVAYRIGDSAKVMAISIFCPYSFTWSGGNTLALKFYQWDQSQIESMPTNYMYDKMNIEGPWKKSFHKGTPPLEVTDEGVEYNMMGGMGNLHATTVQVSLLPIDKNGQVDKNRLAARVKPGFGVEEPMKVEISGCSVF